MKSKTNQWQNVMQTENSDKGHFLKNSGFTCIVFKQ